MSELAEDIRNKMMGILKQEEERTDLDNLSVLSTVGMKVATSNSAELDADAVSASSTALIDLGLRLSEATDHGALKEIVLHNNAGYSILMAINEEYIVFGGLKAVYRIGYYLGYLRELAKKLNILISNGEISEMALSLKEEEELEKLEKQKQESSAGNIAIPSAEQDKQAMDELLGFLDDWDKEEKEAMGVEDFEELESTNIVSIPKSVAIGIPKANETVSIPEEVVKELIQEKSKFKLYEDEVPPVPLEDYTPMEIEDKSSQDTAAQVSEYDKLITPKTSKTTKAELFTAPERYPSFDDLNPPDFEATASEYDTEFVLEEESEALDSVLKDLGWEEDEE
jgi:predicted regulator of Ras-like GTPase activity (Roadblock/LC7/MglB family)